MSNGPFDIVVIGDFRFPGGAASGPAEQIRAQAGAGYRTALVHVKGPVLKYPHPFNPGIRRCLDEGLAELVDPEGEVEAPLVLAFHPQIFTHRPQRPLRVKGEQKIFVISHPLVDGTGEPYYDWQTINENVQDALGGNVPWAPLGPLVRQAFPHIENPPPLYEHDWLEILDIDAWATKRDGFNGDRPVIGRHSRPDFLKWPDDPETTLAAYPDDPAFKVKVLGAGDFLTEHLGEIPANWEVLPFNSVAPDEFLKSIDFFVYYHHSQWVEAYGRVMLEALASGALAVLPKHFEALFGKAAVYAEPGNVKNVVREFFEDRGAYLRQTENANEIIRERFSREAHVRRIKKLIGAPRKQPSAGKKPTKKPPLLKPRRALFLTSNGVGMGHLTRMLAVARRCRPDIQPVFATMSQAFRVVQDQGYMCE